MGQANLVQMESQDSKIDVVVVVDPWVDLNYYCGVDLVNMKNHYFLDLRPFLHQLF